MRSIDVKLKRGFAIAVLAAVSVNPVLSAEHPPESPVQLVRQTVENEISAGNGGANAMFTSRKQTPYGSQTKLLVNTREGMAGMIVANNDKPLTVEERQNEEARLTGLMGNPEQLKRKQKTEKEDSERTMRIMKALPGAFLYEPDGTEIGTQEMGKASDQLVRLKFRPNPQYVPPTRVEQVLTGMQGYLLIDVEHHRIAKIDGTLNKEVSFGWGFLGHLDKGGHFMVQQAEVVKDNWEITRMSLAFTGRVLLVKALNIKSDEVFSNFRPVPSDLTFAQGVDLLKKQEAELAQNRAQSPSDNQK